LADVAETDLLREHLCTGGEVLQNDNKTDERHQADRKGKLITVLKAERDTVKGIARRNQVSPYQLKMRRKKKTELEAAVKQNPRAM
jgi:hypothetical protein